MKAGHRHSNCWLLRKSSVLFREAEEPAWPPAPAPSRAVALLRWAPATCTGTAPRDWCDWAEHSPGPVPLSESQIITHKLRMHWRVKVCRQSLTDFANIWRLGRAPPSLLPKTSERREIQTQVSSLTGASAVLAVILYGTWSTSRS